MKRFVYVFLDGVGLGEAAPRNPFTPFVPSGLLSVATSANLLEDINTEQVQPAPFLAKLLGGPFVRGLEAAGPELLLKPIDAQLGVPGLPQSATGQTSLYTGQNAPAYLGRHLTGFANGSLRILIEASGIFKQVLALGGTVTLANLYTPAYFEAIEQRRLRYAVGTLLALTAGVAFRMPADFDRGEAINWDITNHHLAARGVHKPILEPVEAGRRIADLSLKYNLTLFESFLTDFAGHAQDLTQAREVVGIIDGFLQGLFEAVDPNTTVVVSSDHGNIEDLSRKTHTLNPVPLLVKGPDATAFAPIANIAQITPTIVKLLS